MTAKATHLPSDELLSADFSITRHIQIGHHLCSTFLRVLVAFAILFTNEIVLKSSKFAQRVFFTRREERTIAAMTVINSFSSICPSLEISKLNILSRQAMDNVIALTLQTPRAVVSPETFTFRRQRKEKFFEIDGTVIVSIERFKRISEKEEMRTKDFLYLTRNMLRPNRSDKTLDRHQ